MAVNQTKPAQPLNEEEAHPLLVALAKRAKGVAAVFIPVTQLQSDTGWSVEQVKAGGKALQAAGLFFPIDRDAAFALSGPGIAVARKIITESEKQDAPNIE